MLFKIVQGEVDRCIGIMLEAAHWGRDHGKNLWSDEALEKSNLLQYYKEEEFYLLQVDGQDAGAFVLQWEDQVFWPEFTEDEAGYIHKLVIKREYAGQGISDVMIQKAVEICKARGISTLRLDTGWNNDKLIEIYQRNEFVLFDKFLLEGQYAFARMERKLDQDPKSFFEEDFDADIDELADYPFPKFG